MSGPKVLTSCDAEDGTVAQENEKQAEEQEDDREAQRGVKEKVQQKEEQREEEDTLLAVYAALRSVSKPQLTPLQPREAARPRFADLSRLLHHEPAEFEPQRRREAQRGARRLVHAACRVALEKLEPEHGGSHKGEGEMMRTLSEPSLGSPQHRWPPSTRAPYTCKPFQSPTLSRHSSSSFPRSGTGLHASESSRPRRETTLKKLQSFGQLQHGAPYSLCQVHAEIEARVQHREPRNTRALTGSLGPVHLGRGTTRMQRQLPFMARRETNKQNNNAKHRH